MLTALLVSPFRNSVYLYHLRFISLAFSKEFVEEAVSLLVTRFIPLDPKDLEAWVADPEEWANSEDKESEQWEYELRVCYQA